MLLTSTRHAYYAHTMVYQATCAAASQSDVDIMRHSQNPERAGGLVSDAGCAKGRMLHLSLGSPCLLDSDSKSGDGRNKLGAELGMSAALMRPGQQKGNASQNFRNDQIERHKRQGVDTG